MNKLSKDDLIDIIEMEGLGYAIMDYLNPESIEDAEIKKLWYQAKEAMAAIVEKLEID